MSNRIYLEWEQRSAPDGPWITMVTMTFPETEENMDMLIEASNIDEDEDEDGLTLFIERRNFHIVKIISEEQVIWRKEL